jgi:ATP-dependent DNA helicase PIF1
VNERNELISSSITPSSPRAALLRKTSLIVWDEAPMANRAVLSCVDQALRTSTGVDEEFGGKVVVLLGDFRQTCPVVKYGGREDIIDASIRSSSLWDKMRIFHLTEPIRAAEDLPFAEWLDDIGNGTYSKVSLDLVDHLDKPDDMIDFAFPADVLSDAYQCAKRSILAVTNRQVETYNNKVLKRVSGTEKTYYATDTVKELDEKDDDFEHTAELHPSAILDYIAKHTPNGCPPWTLRVKEGGVYRLMRNLSIERGLVKNVRVLVRVVGQRIVTVSKVLADAVDEENILIPRIVLECGMPGSTHVVLRRQFPLAAAYATTFNSCQGLTLDKVAVDLTRPVFSHGQLYTALSRARNRRDCAVLLPDGQSTTRNVVYSELLV